MDKLATDTLHSMVCNTQYTDEELIAYIQYKHELLSKVECVDDNMNTWLHVAATHNRIQFTTFLLQQKSFYHGYPVELPCNIMATNMQGRTALHLAASKGYTRLVVILVLHCPLLLSMVDHLGHSAFYYAVMNRKYILAKLMVQQYNCSWLEQSPKEGNSLLQFAVQRGDYETFQFLLEETNSAILYLKNIYGMNCFLTCACIKDKNEVVPIWRYLMKYYMNYFLSSVDYCGRNVLHFACLEGNELFVELLSEYYCCFMMRKQPTKHKPALISFLKRKCAPVEGIPLLEELCFQTDSIFQQSPLSICIARANYNMMVIMIPYIHDWNDTRFSIHLPTLLDDIQSTNLIMQFVMTQILACATNPTNAPLTNLAKISTLLIRHGAKLNSTKYSM